MRINILMWTVLSLIGVFLVALPDKESPVIKFSDVHGPGVFDIIGILFIIVGWLFITVGIWNRRKKILQYKGTKSFSIFLIVIGISYGMIISSVFSDFTFWWAVGILILIFIHILCVYVIIRK